MKLFQNENLFSFRHFNGRMWMTDAVFFQLFFLSIDLLEMVP